MKAIKLFSMAVAALMMAACSNEDNDVQQPAQQARMIPFKATIGPAEGGTRTTITEGTGSYAGKLMVAWNGDEWIALVHNGKKDKVQVTKVNDDGAAVIEGEIDATGTDGEDVVLVYPADAVASVTSGTTYVPNTDPTFLALGFQQDGTLTYIGNNLDAREGSGTLKISGGTATLNNNVTMESKIAVWKLTLTTDGTTPLAANQVTLSIGTNPIAATAVNATGKSEWTLCVVPATLALYSGDFIISAKVGSDTYTYTKAGGVSLATSTYYQSTVTMTMVPPTDLSTLTGNYTAKNGETLTGTLGANVKISIADGATVTLNGVSINADGSSYDREYDYAGITCLGDATIILSGTNTVKGFEPNYPGIYVPENKTVTIKGDGSLTASSNGYGAGIGGGRDISCGNIEIQGGTITATGGDSSAGIGSSCYGSCGNITISGGTITATGGDSGAGIGSSYSNTCGNITISGGSVTATGGSSGAGIGSGVMGNCGDITITSDVTQVTATKGSDASNSIGAGNYGTCGTVSIADPSKVTEN